MAKLLTLFVIIFLVAIGFVSLHYSKEKVAAPLAESTKTTAFDNWKEYSSPSGEFKVMVPALPQHTSELLVDPKTKERRQYSMSVSEKNNGTIFMINVITYFDDKGKTPPENVMTKAMNDLIAASPKNVLKTMQMTEYQRFKALDFTFENDLVFTEGRAIMVGNSLIVLTAHSTKENKNSDEFKYFINSFQIFEKNFPKTDTKPA